MYFLTCKGDVILNLHLYASKLHKTLILAALGHAPKRGCYIYFDASQKPIYVGKSKDIQSRLLQQATQKGIECQLEWAFLGIIITNDDTLKEKELILSLQPPFNILNK